MTCIVISALKLMSIRIIQRQPSLHEGLHGEMTSAELNDPGEVQMISPVCQEDIHHCHSDTESSIPETGKGQAPGVKHRPLTKVLPWQIERLELKY